MKAHDLGESSLGYHWYLKDSPEIRGELTRIGYVFRDVSRQKGIACSLTLGGREVIVDTEDILVFIEERHVGNSV